MDISVKDLRAAANRLFDHLQESGRDVVNISSDYYWAIPAESLYNISIQPSDFTIGQLSDDFRELKQIVEGNEPLSYALVWLAAVLRAVGEEIEG